MSSHHFVREGQEPALLILEPTSYSDAEGMLEWAPLVVVVESALNEVLLWGIKIDAVIASPHNESKLTVELAHQAPVKIFSAGADLVEASFLFLAACGEKAVSILAHDFSSTLASRIQHVSGALQVTVRTPGQKWSFIPSGNFKKWYQAGAIINLSISAPNGVFGAFRKTDSAYELTEDQWVTIENQPPFWISEQL